MVASKNLIVYLRLLHKLPHVEVADKIVEPPTCISVPACCFETPPGILPFQWMKSTESVHPPFVQKVGEVLTLFEGKPRTPLTFLRIGDVDFLVANIHVPTDERRFLLTQFLTVSLENDVELLSPILVSDQLGPGVWHIDHNEIEVFEL